MIRADKKPVSRRGDRIIAILEREAAQFIAREAGNESLITVIRAQSVAHGERMMVFVSVFPVEKARLAIAFLEHRREAFSNYLKTRVPFSLPRIDFMLDNGEGNELPRGQSGN